MRRRLVRHVLPGTNKSSIHAPDSSNPPPAICLISRNFYPRSHTEELRRKIAQQLALALDSKPRRSEYIYITSDPIQDRWAVGQRKVTASLIAGPL